PVAHARAHQGGPMNTRHCHLLALALAGSVAAPFAMAQDTVPVHDADAAIEGNELERLDTDGDARISAEEAMADTAFETRFTEIDTDMDGFVTEAELGIELEEEQVPQTF